MHFANDQLTVETDNIPLGSLATMMPLRLISGSGWTEHLPFAFWLVEHLRPLKIVELGVYSGVSYGAFCQAVSQGQLPTRCMGVDTFKGDPQAGFYGPEILRDLRAFHDPLYGHFSELVQGVFDEALAKVEDHSVDLLHLDGTHFYEDVRHDFESWLPKLSPRAIVLFHDTRVTERDFGVPRFWNEVRQSYPSFEFHHGHGLGVLAVGSAPSDVLMSLMHANGATAASLRDFFSALGGRLTLLIQARETFHLPDQVQALENQQVLIQGAFMKLAERLQNTVKDAAEKSQAASAEAARLNAGLHEQQRRNEKLQRRLSAVYSGRIRRSFKSRWVAAFPGLGGRGLRAQLGLIRASGLFDAAHYVSQLPKDFHAKDPLTHYFRVGWKCGLSPHALFDSEWYLQRYPEVRKAGHHPLLDYIEGGSTQTRWPNPRFNGDEYVARHHQEMSPGQTPLAHFLVNGGKG